MMERQSRLVYVLMIFLVLQVSTTADALRYADDDIYRNEEYHNEDDDNGMGKSSLTIGARGVEGDNGDLSDSEYLRHTIKTLRVDVSSLRRAVRDLYKDELSTIRKGVELLVKHQIGEEMVLEKPSRRIVDIVGSPRSLEGFLRQTVYAPGFGNYRPSTNVPSEEEKQDQRLDGYLHEQFGGHVWPFSAYDFGEIKSEYISK